MKIETDYERRTRLGRRSMIERLKRVFRDDPRVSMPEPSESMTWVVHATWRGDLAAWSKNSAWRRGRGQRRHGVHLSAEARAARLELANALRGVIRRELGSRSVRRARTWVWIHVHRADMRSDPVNVIDQVLDAVEDAIGVDDRWYVLGGLTWQLAGPARPGLEVWVGQKVDHDEHACSSCGKVLPAPCRACPRAQRAARKRMREELEGPPPAVRPSDPPPWI